MKLDNTFTIPVPAAQAWQVLLDLERIAPCVPGATITSREGDDFHGKIKVKLGPVGLSYSGVIKVVSQDEAAGIAVLEGRGRETRGNGTAKATITCRLVESDGSTDVFVDTDLAITGKPAQFGRGALADVAGTLIGQFATNLADEITASATPEADIVEAVSKAGDAATPAASPAATAPRKPAEPIDLLRTAGASSATRLSGLAFVGVLALLLALLLRKRSARSAP
ncbi:SRPBCC family protein [Nocardia gamkensis]|uniref:SRPBCC family protein n=1 Tax=Nocardia gamkensis TaxID=352869 RepID=A0A7X6KZU0_9NOCA|nr:SRPBCC family protein [Nocardia gamkensis]NKY25212.1 SRPBCC family protein [Nocardia gamkensis]NQE70208.1 Carbon-monoxide dehydrogenase (acceptor) [Nocardia gamkensis]